MDTLDKNPGAVSNDPGVPTSSSLTQELDPILTVPGRYRQALMHVVDDAVSHEFSGKMGAWFHENRRHFIRGGDEQGLARYNYELTDVEKVCPHLDEFHAMMVERFPEALDACKVPDFDLRYIEVHATLYHHGSFFTWHDDAPGHDGELVATRRMTFCCYLHTEPKMFSGGELEFLDGTRIEPANRRLAFFHPMQQHQVRAVECYSREPLHGRWALMGWVHGDPPPGYVESVPKMRGLPGRG